jgi:hypothetical protein
MAAGPLIFGTAPASYLSISPQDPESLTPERWTQLVDAALTDQPSTEGHPE